MHALDAGLLFLTLLPTTKIPVMPATRRRPADSGGRANRLIRRSPPVDFVRPFSVSPMMAAPLLQVPFVEKVGSLTIRGSR